MTPHPHPAADLTAADCRDTELMLRLWHGGPACQDVALDLADQNRRAARTSIVETNRKEMDRVSTSTR